MCAMEFNYPKEEGHPKSFAKNISLPTKTQKRGTNKHRVKTEDASRVRHLILNYLPGLSQKTSAGESDSQLTN